MTMPPALYSQLFILAFDRREGRIETAHPWLFGMALRAAMLTDLYLDGYLEDVGGAPCPTSATAPVDPLLAALLDKTAHSGHRDWARAILQGHRNTAHEVLRQLVINGQPTNERLLALGLLAMIVQIPGIPGGDESYLHQGRLDSLIDHAVPPLRGMKPAVRAMQLEIIRLENEAAAHRT